MSCFISATRLDVAERHADVQGRGIRVVGRLRAVDVVVRVAELVLALLVPHQLQGPVGDHLVGVHVRRGARAALKDVDDELVVQLAVHQLLAGALDPRQDLPGELLAVVVGPRRRQLDHGERLDQVGIEPQLDARDVKVLQRPRGLDAVVGVRRDRQVSQQIALVAGIGLSGAHEFSAQIERGTCIEPRLDPEVVHRESVGEVLPPAPLELQARHHVLDRVPEEVRAGVLAAFEGVGQLPVAVVDVEARIADRGRERVAPVEVVVGDHAEDGKRLARDRVERGRDCSGCRRPPARRSCSSRCPRRRWPRAGCCRTCRP